jgi:hypothetical protein
MTPRQIGSVKVTNRIRVCIQFLTGRAAETVYIESLWLSAIGKQISLDINPFYRIFIFFHDHFALEA